MRKISELCLVIFILNFIAPSIAHADSDWYSEYLERVSAIQAEQPHWVTPVFTTTPRLEQEFRTDISVQSAPNGVETYNIGNGKGLEFIPFNNVEIILGVPPYIEHNNPNKLANSFGDMPTLIKYRILSANAENGDYILTAFLGTSIPLGSAPNGGIAAVMTPSISAGKGFGEFDIQSTLGIALPLADTPLIGQTLSWNTAFQYHVESASFWPEVECVMSHFSGAKNNGKTQAFIAPGILFGKFPIHNRTAFTVGLGYQFAATTFHTYDNAYVLTMRLPF